MEAKEISGYSIYNVEAKKRTKINPLTDIYPKLPNKKYDIIYADPPWDYNGKMQYDKSSIKTENVGFKKNIFISSAAFKYPTLKLKELKELDVKSIAADDCLLFMWTTGPQMANAVELGQAWGFEYKTVAFVWDKMVHNPGRYTLSQTEFCLVFKRGRIPTPRGARNIRQLVQVPRGKHSEKPEHVIDGITKMFPKQRKIELFARKNYNGWDNWGLEIPDSKIDIFSQVDADQSMLSSQASIFED
ncbi:MAG: modification methylase [Ruminococcaceae bacterium]|jgi:N6-adenosine-specific RNA methylase IME4|nr:modification methylase [Oscillospiraceae bacterium]